jgi:hypothetical protein
MTRQPFGHVLIHQKQTQDVKTIALKLMKMKTLDDVFLTQKESCTVSLDWHDCNIPQQMATSSHTQHSSPNSYFLTHAIFLTKQLLPHTCNIPHQIATSSYMQHSSANSCFLTHATFLSKQLLPHT